MRFQLFSLSQLFENLLKTRNDLCSNIFSWLKLNSGDNTIPTSVNLLRSCSLLLSLPIYTIKDHKWKHHLPRNNGGKQVIFRVKGEFSRKRCSENISVYYYFNNRTLPQLQDIRSYIKWTYLIFLNWIHKLKDNISNLFLDVIVRYNNSYNS